MDHGVTAVIVASEELFGVGLAGVLAARGMAASVLGRVADALAAPAEAVGLVVVDVDAPGVDGERSMRRLRQRFPTAHVVISAPAVARERTMPYFAWGVRGVVLRTQPGSEIAAALEVVMGGGVCVPPAATEAQEARTEATRRDRPAARPLAPPTRPRLSPRQEAVLELLASGKSNKDIARDLGLAEGTVKVHVSALLRALNVRNRASAVAALNPRSAPVRRAVG